MSPQRKKSLWGFLSYIGGYYGGRGEPVPGVSIWSECMDAYRTWPHDSISFLAGTTNEAEPFSSETMFHGRNKAHGSTHRAARATTQTRYHLPRGKTKTKADFPMKCKTLEGLSL